MDISTAVVLLKGLTGITSPGDVGVILGCFAGVYASAAWSSRLETRAEMFRLYAACVIMGLSFTVVANAVIGFTFQGFALTQGVRAGAGAIVSCLTRFWLPNVIETIRSGKWTNWVPFLRNN